MRHQKTTRLQSALGAGALLVALCAPALAHAQQEPAPPPPPPGDERPAFGRRHGPPPFEDVLERNAERLGLDDATRAKVRAVADEARPEGDRLREEVRAAHREMRTLLGQDTPDEAAVLAQADRIGQAETALQKQRLRTMLAIRALLTPAQRAELVKIHEERRTGWKAKREKWGRGGPPAPPDGGVPPPPPDGVVPPAPPDGGVPPPPPEGDAPPEPPR
jgi:Spy/CpxP family protein refolding chaperone